MLDIAQVLKRTEKAEAEAEEKGAGRKKVLGEESKTMSGHKETENTSSSLVAERERKFRNVFAFCSPAQ